MTAETPTQWLHYHSFTGTPMWMDCQEWMGRKSEISRPAPARQEQLIERLRAMLTDMKSRHNDNYAATLTEAIAAIAAPEGECELRAILHDTLSALNSICRHTQRASVCSDPEMGLEAIFSTASVAAEALRAALSHPAPNPTQPA